MPVAEGDAGAAAGQAGDMATSQIYVVVAVIALAIVVVLVFLVGRRKNQNRLSPLAGLAFAFILASILFGEEKTVGYGLIGIGVILAVVDIFYRSRRAARPSAGGSDHPPIE